VHGHVEITEIMQNRVYKLPYSWAFQNTGSCFYNVVRSEFYVVQTSVVTILIPGRDQRDQPIVFDAVHATLGCMSEIIRG